MPEEPERAKDKIRAMREKLLELKTLYEADSANKTFNALICGRAGSGKTQLLSTARMPLLIHNFDPGGHKTRALQPLIQKGAIQIKDFSTERTDAPRMFNAWRQEVRALKELGAFEYFATYALDSFGPWMSAMMNHIVDTKEAGGATRRAHVPAQPDYLIALMRFQDLIRDLAALPCDFILTCHLMNNKDEITGEITTEVKTFNSMRPEVPAIFDEVYVMKVQSGNPPKYQLLTQTEGRLEAKTRIGGGVFSQYEEPDIKKLLFKAGLAHQDKEIMDLGGGE